MNVTFFLENELEKCCVVYKIAYEGKTQTKRFHLYLAIPAQQLSRNLSFNYRKVFELAKKARTNLQMKFYAQNIHTYRTDGRVLLHI